MNKINNEKKLQIKKMLIENYSVEQISKILSISKNSVYNHWNENLERKRKHFSRNNGENCFFFSDKESKSKIKTLSNGIFCGIEEIDFQTAKYLTQKNWDNIFENINKKC